MFYLKSAPCPHLLLPPPPPPPWVAGWQSYPWKEKPYPWKRRQGFWYLAEFWVCAKLACNKHLDISLHQKFKTENLPSAWTSGIPVQQRSSFVFQAPEISLSVAISDDKQCHLFFAFSAMHFARKDIALGIGGQIFGHENIIVLIHSQSSSYTRHFHRICDCFFHHFVLQKWLGGFLCNNVGHLEDFVTVFQSDRFDHQYCSFGQSPRGNQQRTTPNGPSTRASVHWRLLMIQYICLQLNLKFSLKDSIYLFEIKSCWHLICQTQARPDIMAIQNHNFEKCHVMEYIEYDHNCIEHNHNYEKCHISYLSYSFVSQGPWICS